MSDVSVLGIDLAKNVFELCGQDQAGRVIYRKRLRRAQLLHTLALMPACRIGMEACAGAHHWARRLREHGHTVRLIPAQYVKPYLKGNKTDRNDAEAICEATTRAHVPEVAIKSEAQQAIAAYHRARSLLVKQRSALGNALRALLAEFGRVGPRGALALRSLVLAALADEALPALLREAIQTQWSQWLHLDESIGQMDRQLDRLAHSEPMCRAMLEVPGIGAKTATALLAAVADARVFASGRAMAAWLGLVPRQHSSGERVQLGGISKRGDAYLRGLLIHGARSALVRSQRDDPQLAWARALEARRGRNKAVVALANKRARLLWAMMSRNEPYRHAA